MPITATYFVVRYGPLMDMDPLSTPTLERRIKAAMALAGLDWDGLAERIDTPNYGPKTLYNIASETFEKRSARSADLHIIGKACGVSDAFWTIDFRELQEPVLRDELTRLSQRVDEIAAQAAADAARQAQALREHREKGHQAGGSQGGAR